MVRIARRSSLAAALALCAATPSLASAQGFSWALAGGSDGWPGEKRDAIQRAMDEASAQYNAEGYFDKHDTANYSAGVPTAQSNYDGWIDFGGSINPRVGMHEIAHTMGVGTYSRPFDGAPWDANAAAGRLIKLYEGQGASISTGGTHFWPYGLNYDNEDGPAARVRHVRIVMAMRFDMGIVKDTDGDGLRDDWEKHFFGGLAENARGDFDRDGISNADEQASDLDPALPCPLTDGHRYVIHCRAGDLVVTASDAGAVLHAADGSAAQAWTAHYVGAGFFVLSSADGRLLGVPGTDTANDIPVQLAADARALRQQWRAASDASTRSGYFALYNRETARVLDATTGKDSTVLKQYSLTGGADAPQQYWRFEDLTPSASADPGRDDAGVAADPGAQDGGAQVGDGGASGASGGEQPDGDSGGDSQPPLYEPPPSNAGCALGGGARDTNSAPALGGWMALLGLALQRRRAPRKS